MGSIVHRTRAAHACLKDLKLHHAKVLFSWDASVVEWDTDILFPKQRLLQENYLMLWRRNVSSATATTHTSPAGTPIHSLSTARWQPSFLVLYTWIRTTKYMYLVLNFFENEKLVSCYFLHLKDLIQKDVSNSLKQTLTGSHYVTYDHIIQIMAIAVIQFISGLTCSADCYLLRSCQEHKLHFIL